MSENVEPKPGRLPIDVRRILSRLRWKIRTYVWLEGMALAVLWLGTTFWVVLGLDYLPVLLGLSEMPPLARGVLLVVVACMLALILYRWVIRRVFVRLGDQSMAILIERRFPHLKDSLVTSVEMAHQPDHAFEFNADMLADTRQNAAQRIQAIEVNQVFNFKPLALRAVGATLVALTVSMFALLNQEAFVLGAQRLYLLDNQPWPRRCSIEVIGVKIIRDDVELAHADVPDILPFENGQVKVARGASVALLVRADADVKAYPQRKVPRTCSIYYRTGDGDRGTQTMKKMGNDRKGYQDFVFDGKPFKGVLTDIVFDVKGGDDRKSQFKIQVVDNPVVIKTELSCSFPTYLVDEQSGAWTDRVIPWTSGTELPKGTRFTVQLQANKPIHKAFVSYPKAEETSVVIVEPSHDQQDRFSITIPSLDADVSMDVLLLDQDQVLAEKPHHIFIQAIEDQPPHVTSRLQGIGTAVTPDVRIPITGQIKDDYGVARSWVEIQSNEIESMSEDFGSLTAGAVSHAIDFRVKRQDMTAPISLEPGEGNRLVLTVKSADHFDLDGSPNIGVGDQFTLDIVTPNQLLRILERLEVNQRRRVDQIYEEMTQAKDYVRRARRANIENDLGLEPGESSSSNDSNDDSLQQHELRLLYAQRALAQSRKSAQEVLGVAASFQDLRQQLINNRVDSEDRKKRLKDDVIEPLQRIGNQSFPELEKRILALEAELKAWVQHPTELHRAESVDQQGAQAIQQTDLVLAELNEVLKNLVKYESYSELLEIVRQLIREQEELIKATEQERKRQAFGELLK